MSFTRLEKVTLGIWRMAMAQVTSLRRSSSSSRFLWVG